MTLGDVLKKTPKREVISINCRSVNIYQGRFENLNYADYPKLQDQEVSRFETSLLQIDKDLFPVFNLVIDSMIDFVGA